MILQPHFVSQKSRISRSVSVVSAVVRRPTPLSLEDSLADVAVSRGVGRVLVLGRDVPQQGVLRRECDAALVAVRRRHVDAAPDRWRSRLQRLYKLRIPPFT